MSRETVDGVLHVIQVRKRYEGLFTDYVASLLEEAGRVKTRYYSPDYYIKAGSRPGFQYRFRGRPKALSPDLKGHRVVIRTGVEPWSNGLGGYLVRPEVVEVGEYVECPYHDDPYDDPKHGSDRIYCKQPQPVGEGEK